MSTRIAFSVFACCAATFAAATTAAKVDLSRVTPVPSDQPIPVVDFFRPRLLHSPVLNRTGTHMAALVAAGRDRNDLLIFDLEKKSFETLHALGDKDIYHFQWLTDRRLVYMLSEDKQYALGMMALDVDQMRSSYALLTYAGARLVSVPEKNRLKPLVWRRFDAFDAGKDLGVCEIDTDIHSPVIDLSRARSTSDDSLVIRDNNQKHVLRTYPLPEGIGSGYLGDRMGELAFAFTGRDGVITAFRLAENTWQRCPIDLDEIGIVTAGDNAGDLLVNGPRQEGKPRALQFMAAATGQLGDVLLQDKAYDFYGDVVRDPKTRQIVGVRYQRSGPTSVWFDENYRAIQKALDASFPKQVAQVIDVDLNGRLLVATYSDRQPVIYHRVDLAQKSIGLIKNSAPWIDPARMQPMHIFPFQTRDGRKLEAYVTLPAGTSKKKPAPLVVLPHGGPWVRDTWGFDGEAQFLASRGYAVMQPNYRGSRGYDWIFPESDRYAFRKMHDDVTDATKALMAAGFIDSKRVAIMGSSFGAYLALSGVAHEPELYRCAVAIAGVFDWETVMKADKYSEYHDNTYAYLKRKLGDPAKEREKFAAISPLRFVDQVKAPMFVAHGKSDKIADVGESQRLIAELKKHNVPCDELLVGGEGHGMAHIENQVELYTRVESFLGKHLAAPAANALAPTSVPSAP